MDSEDIQRHRPRWAVRFSATMHTLNPGVQIAFRWLRCLVGLVALVIVAWRAPEAVSWLS